MKEYAEEDFLPLAGIQHFCFCRRQWALIHVEDQWEENIRTVEGKIVHERAHDAALHERRGSIIVSRGMRIFSRTLGLSGACDVVEFHEDKEGVTLFGREGRFLPVPIEYKRGRPKEFDADIMQLTAQAMCLSEMLSCEVSYGYLFYDEIKRRQRVEFNEELTGRVRKMCEEMHGYFERRYTPKVKTGKSCKACSLSDLCLPKLCGRISAKAYIEKSLKGDGLELGDE